MKTLALVVAVGARTPLGLNAVQSGFLLRQGIPAITNAPLADEDGEPITMCFDRTIDPMLTGGERAGRLADAAMTDALSGLGDAARYLRIRLVICLAERGTSVAESSIATARILTRARELTGDFTHEVVARGGAGAAYGLPAALAALGRQEVDAILVGGVHTDYDPVAIADLGQKGRLYSHTNLDSLIPGEVAAFALLTRDDVARRIGLPPRARIHGIGQAYEKARADNDESAFEAAGLTSAMREALSALDDGMKVGWGLSDLTFELQRLYEWTTVMTRTHQSWGAPLMVDSPAQRVGRLGAAALPLHIVLAAEAWRRGYAPASLALAFAGSDSGERGVVLLGSP